MFGLTPIFSIKKGERRARPPTLMGNTLIFFSHIPTNFVCRVSDWSRQIQETLFFFRTQVGTQWGQSRGRRIGNENCPIWPKWGTEELPTKVKLLYQVIMFNILCMKKKNPPPSKITFRRFWMCLSICNLGGEFLMGKTTPDVKLFVLELAIVGSLIILLRGREGIGQSRAHIHENPFAISSLQLFSQRIVFNVLDFPSWCHKRKADIKKRWGDIKTFGGISDPNGGWQTLMEKTPANNKCWHSTSIWVSLYFLTSWPLFPMIYLIFKMFDLIRSWPLHKRSKTKVKALWFLTFSVEVKNERGQTFWKLNKSLGKEVKRSRDKIENLKKKNS